MCLGSRKAIIVHVPYRLRKAFQKIHARLVRELEKKFSGKVHPRKTTPFNHHDVTVMAP